MLNSLATVSLINTALHSRDETGLVFEHTADGFFHQLLCILAIAGGQLVKPCFNVG